MNFSINSGNGRGDIIIALSSLYDEDFLFFLKICLWEELSENINENLEGIRAIKDVKIAKTVN